jgi:general secretion pathway protein L
MFGEFVTWWCARMGELLAPVSPRGAAGGGSALVLTGDPAGTGIWRLMRRRGASTVPLASVANNDSDASWRSAFAIRKRGEAVVVVPGQPFLVRRTTVPVAASANLDQMLRYEMDRLTPFGADDVLATHRVVARDAANGRLVVELAIVPRAWIEDGLRRLASLSINPAAIEDRASQAGQPMNERPWRIPLARQADSRWLRPDWRVAAWSCAVLLLVVLATPIIRQSLALQAVADRTAELRPRMDEVDALRKRIAASTAGAGLVETARRHAAETPRVLGVLTELLPDDTYLTTVSLRNDKLTIEGRSSAATRLIATMAADPRLKSPTFSAPVVRATDSTDAFTIQVGIGS